MHLGFIDLCLNYKSPNCKILKWEYEPPEKQCLTAMTGDGDDDDEYIHDQSLLLHMLFGTSGAG